MRITGDLSFGKDCTALEYLIQFLNGFTAEVTADLAGPDANAITIIEGAVDGLNFPDIPGADPGSKTVSFSGTNVNFAGGLLPSGSGTVSSVTITARVDGTSVTRLIEFPQPVNMDDLLAETARSGETSKSIDDYPGFVAVALPNVFNFLDEQGTNLRDLIKGFESADFLDGGAGKDKIIGNGGDDDISGGKGDDVVNAGSGADNVSGGAGDDTIKGGRGTDELLGGSGNDLMLGQNGDDVIRGDAGKDTLRGNKGDDLLEGGGGADTIILKKGDGDDTLIDFNFGQDQIRFKGADSIGDLTFEQIGDAVVIGYRNISLTVEDQTVAALEDPDIFGF